MFKVHETIFSCKIGIEKVVIPMADVQHIEVEEWGGNIGNKTVRNVYTVITCHTIRKNGKYLNSIRLKHNMGAKFMRAWCDYRSELDEILPSYSEIEEK